MITLRDILDRLDEQNKVLERLSDELIMFAEEMKNLQGVVSNTVAEQVSEREAWESEEWKKDQA